MDNDKINTQDLFEEFILLYEERRGKMIAAFDGVIPVISDRQALLATNYIEVLARKHDLPLSTAKSIAYAGSLQCLNRILKKQMSDEEDLFLFSC